MVSSGGNQTMHREIIQRVPSLNTDAVQSRLRQLGVNTSARTELSFPTTAGGAMTWREKTVGMDITLAASADLGAALRVASEALLPAAVPQIERWIGELSVITARRAESQFEAELSLSAYSSRLAGYPGDIVRDTVLGWSGKWFPTWAELKDIMDVRTAPRLAIRDAIQRQISPPTPPQDITALKRELALLEDRNMPREWAFLPRDEQVERVDARINELKAVIAAIAP